MGKRYVKNHGSKSLDLQEIYEINLSFFVVFLFVSKLRRFKQIGAVNTFLTASTITKRPPSPLFKRTFKEDSVARFRNFVNFNRV